MSTVNDVTDRVTISDNAVPVQAQPILDIVLVNPTVNSSAELNSKIASNTNDINQMSHAMSTGFVSGCNVTVGSPTSTINIAPGVGHVVDHSVSPPAITIVTVTTKTNVPITDISTQESTEIGIDINGDVVQQLTFTEVQRRSIFTIAVVPHVNLTSVGTISQSARVICRDIAAALFDLFTAMQPIMKSGANITANGINLKLDVTAGQMFALGTNKDQVTNPNFVFSDALSGFTFLATWRDGAGGFNRALETDLRPGFYDDGTGGVGVPNGIIGSNKWSKLRIYIAPRGPGLTSILVMHYGTAEYNSSAEAIDAFEQTFEINPAVAAGTLKRADIAIRGGATDLTDITHAVFFPASRFGETHAFDGQ